MKKSHRPEHKEHFYRIDRHKEIRTNLAADQTRSERGPSLVYEDILFRVSGDNSRTIIE